jgi:hypothetical protein
VNVEIESKNKLAAFLKFLVAMQYNPSYTFNLFFLSQSPPSSNRLPSGKAIYQYTKFHNTNQAESEIAKLLETYFLALSMDFEMRSKSI